MHDPWTERLSEYLDRELSAVDAAALEAHLGTCAACTSALRELRAVVAAAAAAADAPPQRDLWSGIAHAITTAPAEGVQPIRPQPAGAAEAHADATGQRPAAPARSARVPRRFSLSLPQLAAAAVVLMALSGGAVWLLDRPAAPGIAGAIVHTAAQDDAARLVASETPADDVAWDRDVAELERLLDEHRDRLDPATIEVIERSMDSIDRAIADARAAVQADPANPHLHRQLDSTMRMKVSLLRRATRGAS